MRVGRPPWASAVRCDLMRLQERKEGGQGVGQEGAATGRCCRAEGE